VYIKLLQIALNRLTWLGLGTWGLGLGAWGVGLGAVPRPAAADEVHVAAAVSLSEALQEVTAAFERQHGIHVTLNLAASNVLARQITAGAKTDVFISADAIQMGVVRQAGHVRGVVDLLLNRLVVLVAADSPISLAGASDLRRPEIARIAIGDPAGVPAGAYAKQYLQNEKVWDLLQPKIVTTASVRAALAALDAGNVDAAIVYQTDARIARRARVAYPSPSEPVVTYPAALFSSEPGPAQFFDYLRSAEASRIFERHGFGLPVTRGESPGRAKGRP
jgi:molybdate transport system substrate-binding protein